MAHPDWSSRAVDLPWLTLHLRELGPAGRPLLLLHGLGVDGSIWQAVGRRLRPTFRLLAPDLRGHGRSDHPPAGYTARDYAADIAELLAQLAAELGPLALLGHSLGALAALGAAAMQPEAVSHLVLEDPPLSGRGAPAAYLDAVLRAKGESSAALLAVVRQFQPALGELVARVQADMWAQTDAGVLRAVLEQPQRALDADRWLEQVPAPTLLMAADPALDARLHSDAAASALRRLRDGHLMQFPGAGHVIHAQRAGEFSRVVGEFLGAVGAGPFTVRLPPATPAGSNTRGRVR